MAVLCARFFVLLRSGKKRREKNEKPFTLYPQMRSLLCSCAARGSAALLRRAHTGRLSSSSKATSSSSSSPPRWRSPRPRPPTTIIGAAPTSSSSSPTSPTPSPSSSSPPPRSGSSDREHPAFPRVGVAAVLFRPRTDKNDDDESEEPSLLLIRRAKPPNAGLWSFPGGALELGETLVAGAERELREEVPGIEFERDASVAGELAGGAAFAAADSIHHDDEGGVEEERESEGGAAGRGGSKGVRKGEAGGRDRRASPRFHWAIVEVAAVAKSTSGPSVFSASAPPPQTADDALGARWIGALSELRLLEEGGEVTPGCARVAEEAVRRFGRDLGYRERGLS